MGKENSRKRGALYFVVALGLLLNLPWFWHDSQVDTARVLPDWVLYMIVSATLFAILVAVLLGAFWDVLSAEQEDRAE